MDKIEKQIPFGRAKILEERKEALPVAEVNNHVLFVNPDFPEMPFKIEEGEGTNLGLFLTTETGQNRTIEIEEEHSRSGLLGRVIFRDTEGRLYRDVDAKGIGHIIFESGDDEHKIKKTAGGIYEDRSYTQKGTMGIMQLAVAYYDKEMSEAFLEKGIGTHRVLAIIGLDEIVVRGKKMSINDAKFYSILPQNSKPVIEIRVFGTKYRLSDIGNDKPKSGEYINDAMKLVEEEKGIKFDNRRGYLSWLAAEIGYNVGLMHKNGWTHNYLNSGHNVTLDGRIVDLDSVRKEEYEVNFFNDKQSARSAFYYFLKYFKDLTEKEREAIENIFEEEYQKAKKDK